MKTASKVKTRKKQGNPLPFQTPGEEIANAILHGIGALVGIAGLILLLLRGAGILGGRGGGATALTAYSIYGASMFLLFLASTLYHAIQHEKTKQVFRIFDHGAIYLLIAGTYTPFCLVAIQGPWGWALFGIEWGLAIVGITLYAVGIEALKKIEVAVYILMGWAIVFAGKPLLGKLSSWSLTWLIAGGLFYTLGTIWYRERVRRGTHVTWHAFVLAGAIAHWWSVWTIS